MFAFIYHISITSQSEGEGLDQAHMGAGAETDLKWCMHFNPLPHFDVYVMYISFPLETFVPYMYIFFYFLSMDALVMSRSKVVYRSDMR
jgi:hypothetical protein